MALVTLEAAKAHLVVDHDEDDTLIERLSEQAGAIVVDYLKMDNIWEDSSGNITDVPPMIEAAILMVLGVLYKDREGQTDPLTPAVRSVLMRYRDPAMA